MSSQLIAPCRIIGIFVVMALLLVPSSPLADESTVRIGINLPLSGPYANLGIDQLRAYTLAIEEINDQGGLLGRKLVYDVRDTATDPLIAAENARELIAGGAVMVTGGASSAEAIAQARVCQESRILFLAGLSHSNETTGTQAQRYAFRWFNNAHQSAKALTPIMHQRFGGQATYAFLYADYTWGKTVVDSLTREIVASGGQVLLSLPTPLGATSFFKELLEIRRARPQVLVLVHFGDDLIYSLRQAGMLRLRQSMSLVVPLMEINIAHDLGAEMVQGILTTKSWYHGLAERYSGSHDFVARFEARYRKKPGNVAAVAWVNIFQYADAVRRTQSFEPKRLVAALEGHHFTLLTGDEYWRDWDHQGIHTTYVLMGKKPAEARDQWDLFRILSEQEGSALARSRSENPVQLPPLD